jgi:hypothetical protein
VGAVGAVSMKIKAISLYDGTTIKDASLTLTDGARSIEVQLTTEQRAQMLELCQSWLPSIIQETKAAL